MTLIKATARLSIEFLDAVIVTIAIAVISIAFAVNNEPVKNYFNFSNNPTEVTESN